MLHHVSTHFSIVSREVRRKDRQESVRVALRTILQWTLVSLERR